MKLGDKRRVAWKSRAARRRKCAMRWNGMESQKLVSELRVGQQPTPPREAADWRTLEHYCHISTSRPCIITKQRCRRTKKQCAFCPLASWKSAHHGRTSRSALFRLLRLPGLPSAPEAILCPAPFQHIFSEARRERSPSRRELQRPEESSPEPPERWQWHDHHRTT